MNLCKGSENKELYLNANFLIQDLIANKNLFVYFIEEDFIKGLLDLLEEEDTARFICVCKAVSSIIAQLKKNASSSNESHQAFFDDEDDVMIDQEEGEEKKEAESNKLGQSPLIKLASE